MNTDFPQFKAKLKAYREAYGTQKAFAEYLEVPLATLKHQESGSRSASRFFVQRLIDKTGKPIWYWLTKEEQTFLYAERKKGFLSRRLSLLLQGLTSKGRELVADYVEANIDRLNEQ